MHPLETSQRWTLALLSMLVLAAPCAAWPPASDLGKGILASVDGDNIEEREFFERLTREHGADESAKDALRQLLDTRLIAHEMKTKEVVVTDADVDQKYAALEASMRAQSPGASLEEAIRSQGITTELFRAQLRFLVGLEKLARLEFRVPQDEAVPDSKANLLLAQLRENAEAQFDGLPDGIVAKTTGFEITREEFGRSLVDVLDAETLNTLLRAMATERLIRHAMQEQKIELTPADLDAEIEFLKWAFERAEPYPGVDFDQYLQASQNMTSAELRNSENFRYQTAAKKIARASTKLEARQKKYAETSAHFGPLRRIRHLLISTASRTMEEAIDRFDHIREEIDAGVPFPSLVQQYSDAPDRMKGGDSGYFPKTATFDRDIVDAAFSLKPGDVSAPIRTARGVEMIQVIGEKPLPPFEKADELIVRDLALEWIEARRHAADVKPAWLFPQNKKSASKPSEEG